ncbi:SLBB domain-containing protein [Candidatus Poribacteria bacterium]|nr:SLBB domain-containing protein [Candidatus Poribacteria bacterium]
MKFFCFILFFFFFLLSLNAQELTVSPGDTLFISVWGQEQLSGAVIVGPDGTLSLPPPVGILQVSGMTISQISELLTNRLGEYIKNPRVTVSVRAQEGFTVHVIGEVRVPSFYKVPEGTTLQEAITRAGGQTEGADVTRIRLRRKGKNGETTETTVDLTRFIFQGDLSANPVLLADDVLILPRLSREERSQKVITALGAVQAPGAYEVEAPLPLLDVLALAKGAAPDANLKSVWILTPMYKSAPSHLTARPPSLEGRANILPSLLGEGPGERLEAGVHIPKQISLEDYLTGEDALSNPLISPGTVVFVPSTRLPEERPFLVNVVGQVNRMGAYPVTEGARLMEAISSAGGFADGARIDKITILHREPKSPKELTVNLTHYFREGALSANPELYEGDTIVVPVSEAAKRVTPIQGIFSPSILLHVIGEVRLPGSYQLASTASVLDALTIAGGPTTDADLERVTILRGAESKTTQLVVDLKRVLEEGHFDLLPPLSPQDTLFIPKQRENRRLWLTIIRTARDITTVTIAILVGIAQWRNNN